eukprot:360332-Chlamydomonas_euryale.AAC.1
MKPADLMHARGQQQQGCTEVRQAARGRTHRAAQASRGTGLSMPPHAGGILGAAKHSPVQMLCVLPRTTRHA